MRKHFFIIFGIFTTFNSLTDAQGEDLPKPLNINFYGKIVDEYNKPLVNASILFKIDTSMIDSKAQISIKSFSDKNGVFFIKNIKGYDLYITINKKDYRTYNTCWLEIAQGGTPFNQQNTEIFDINGNPLPNKSSPAIFKLIKE